MPAGRRAKLLLALAICLTLTGIAAAVSSAFSSFGSELIIIDNVSVQSPVMTTYDQCSGYVDHDVPVVPVTVEAEFITSPGVEPTGPYGGVLAWDGGFGAEDDHFGTGQATAPVQFFHVLARSSPYYFHGEGEYTFQAFVQDVGLAGGFTAIEKTVTLPGPPPSGGGARVKCTIAKPYGLSDVLGNVVHAGVTKVAELYCPVCFKVKGAIEQIEYYNELLNNEMGNSVIDDPPDGNYQQIAQPQEPPVLTPPAELSVSQQAAVTELEREYAKDIGLARAMGITVDRVWGADNAGSRYWYVKQMEALSRYSTRLGDDLGSYQQLYETLQAALSPEIPAFSISYEDALNSLVERSKGYPADAKEALATLGASDAQEQQLIDDAIAVDPEKMVTADGVNALFSQHQAGFVTPMRAIAQWATDAVKAQPPVVSDVSPRTLPAGGGAQVTITGTNLSSVTGIDFGPSTPLSGEGQGTTCTDTQCTTYAPSGHGTVDVVAVGPGGPSEISAADTVTYVEPSRPEVTDVFPQEGAKAGGTRVSIWGSGLSEGIVYFGPTAASVWSCGDTHCTAEAPPTASEGTVDIQVVTPGGTSATGPADQFKYVEAPPPPAAPAVSGVSPSSGSDSGGDTVTITGSGFSGATEVHFGEAETESFEVLDDSHIKATTRASYEAETVDVTVTGPGGVSPVSQPADQFTFEEAPPTIAGVSPSAGSDLGGTHFTLTGSHLGNGEGTTISFGGESVEDATCSETRCEGTTPPGADGAANVEVYTMDGEATLTVGFTYEKGPAPTIERVSPDTGAVEGGNDVVISGTNLETGQVTFGDIPAPEATCTETVCVATAPAAPKAEQVDIHISTNAGTTATTPADEYGYVHLARPVVDSVTPPSGYVNGGTEVRITGTDLTSGSVSFGATEAIGETCSQTACEAEAPATHTAGPVDVTVTTHSGSSQPSSSDRFTYVVPAVTGVSPSSGWTLGGKQVTIDGTDLGGSPEESVEEPVYFGERQLTGTCWGDRCTATAPSASENSTTTVDVRVQPFRGPESEPSAADAFTYSPRPLPTVTSISPTSGTDEGGDKITVEGNNLDGGTVEFGTAIAAGSCSHTSCTVTSPHSPSGDQPVDVTVTTPTLGGSLTSATVNADRYTFQGPGVPTITGVSPNHGTVVGGTALTVSGDNLTNAGLKFGATPAADVSCQRTSCTATTPAADAAETVHIVAETGGGTSMASSADAFTYEIPPPPTIEAVNPGEGPSSGDSTVTITGSDLGAGSVAFGAKAAANGSCSETSCTVTSPPGVPGAVDIKVTTPGGTSANGAADRFQYSPVTLTEHSIPGAGSGTGGGQIVRGLGGDLWFTMPNLNEIGRIAANGTITTYPSLDTNGKPVGITEGPEGKMWYSEENPDKLVSIDESGAQTGYQLPGAREDLRFVTAGPDGRLWFTLGVSGTIGAMTTSGNVTLYHLPDPTVFPYNLVVGPDGRIWFTEVYGRSIGAISTDGTVTQYRLPSSGAGGWGLALGLDNRLWFGEWNGRAIGAITTSGQVTTYPVPTAGDDPQGVIGGPDGRIWFTAPDSDAISALDPASGEVQNYPLPGPESNGSPNEAPRYLAMDAEGNLWVTENQGPHVLSVSGITAAVPPRVTAVSPNHGDAGTAVTITGTDLGQASTVDFGSNPASTYTVVDPAHIEATAPSGSEIVHVTVTTPNGTSASTQSDRFSYGTAIAEQPTVTGVSPESGTMAGGTTVTITGTNLLTGTVAFGAQAATGVSCTSTSCTATSPSSAAGPVDVQVTTSGGTSEKTEADRFVYLSPPPPAPVVTEISPASGSDAGGTEVAISGTNLVEPTVSFGLEQASQVTCASTTSCVATAPPAGAGEVDVRVAAAGGTSARTAADKFTYVATSKARTSLALTLSPEVATAGSYSNFTAQVTPAIGGTVQFYFDGAPLGEPLPVEYGYASTYRSELAEGSHSVRAVFLPTDTDFYATASAEAVLKVGEPEAPPSEGEGSEEGPPEGSQGGSPPVNVAPPSISGSAVEGQTLVEGHGSWTNAPGKYSYQWEDCDGSGNGCAAIQGAVAQSYTLTSGDVGRTIRVRETASNSGASSAPAVSAPTGLVLAATPPGPTASQIEAALRQALKVSGKPARIGELLKHHGYVVFFSAPGPGKLTLGWYSPPGGRHKKRTKPQLVAKLRATYAKAEKWKGKVSLTTMGRKLLAHANRLKLVGNASFAPVGGSTVTVSRGIKIKR